MVRLFAPCKFFLSAPFSTPGSAPMLINCVAYQNGYRIGQVTREQISEYVARPDCFVWVALCDATAEELLQMQHEFEKQMECAQQQARAAKELAQQQITSLQQELHSVKTQHRLDATAISHPHTPERLSPCLPPGLLQEGRNRSPLQPAAQRMDSPDRLRD
jgi:hypothetical protein